MLSKVRLIAAGMMVAGVTMAAFAWGSTCGGVDHVGGSTCGNEPCVSCGVQCCDHFYTPGSSQHNSCSVAVATLGSNRNPDLNLPISGGHERSIGFGLPTGGSTDGQGNEEEEVHA